LAINAQYNLAKPESLPVEIAGYQRRKMFESFVSLMQLGAADTILDIGVTSDRTYDHSNYLEAWYPHKNRITALGIDNAACIELLYPGVKFIRADARDLPFANDAFDFVHSSAVLEHVGSRSQQCRFLREAWRVARKGVFVTTPNRRFPVEFHTVLPLIHWLPVPLYRKLLVALGHDFFADENNLNLLSRRSLSQAAMVAGIELFDIGSVSLLGLPSNLLLMARKPAGDALRPPPRRKRRSMALAP
jgi:SAM-dependent methyltransferase